VPATLAESIAVVRHSESDESADEVGRCGADESDSMGAQVEAAYDAWVEVVEAVGGVVGGEHDRLAQGVSLFATVGSLDDRCLTKTQTR
jgi:hypothetical protein